MTDKDLARFWKKVRKDEGDSCWVWTASCLTTGLPYGQFSQDGGRIRTPAHRSIFEHHLGRRLGRWELVCHTCDNPPCVRLDHLFLGSNADNMHDMYSKGRFPIKKGEGHYISKLTEEAVLEIRATYHSVPLEIFAARFGVSEPTITYMLKGKTWKHLGPVPGWDGRKPRLTKPEMAAAWAAEYLRQTVAADIKPVSE